MSVKVTPFPLAAEAALPGAFAGGAAAPRASTASRPAATASRRFKGVFKLNLLRWATRLRRPRNGVQRHALVLVDLLALVVVLRAQHAGLRRDRLRRLLRLEAAEQRRLPLRS